MITQFSGNLSSPVEVGHSFVISGRSVDGASRIDINFAQGKMSGCPVPLHLSIRFHEDIILRNSKIEEDWGDEEREDNLHGLTAPNPIIPGETFKIYVFVGDDKFHISVNEREYCTYVFRTPLEDIRAITINQDIQSISSVDHRRAFPSPFPLIQSDDCKSVFSNDVPRPFMPGHVLVITAIPFGSPKGTFTLRFTELDNRKKQGLHFNPRFAMAGAVIRNTSNEEGVFDQREERDGGFPFVIDQQFKLAIAFTETEFKFAVNGQLFGSFQYRNPNQLAVLNGFKTYCGNGMQLEVTGVDHMNMGFPDCEAFETYSDPDTQIL